MNDQPTTDGEDTPDERVVAAIRDVESTAPAVRRLHLDAALVAYDGLELAGDDDAPVAPVVPLRRRSTRVLQIAAVVLLVLGSIGLAVRLGGGSSQDSAGSAASRSETTVASNDATAENGAVGAVGEPTPNADTAGGSADYSQTQHARSRAAADGAAKGAAASTIAPPPLAAAAGAARVPPGPVPGRIGSFSSRAALRDALQSQVDAGTLPTGIDPAITCPAPPTSTPVATATSADVAGADVVVWVSLGGSSRREVVVVLVDPATCATVG